MALDQADINKIAALLGEVLAPSIRETVLQQTTLRVEAAVKGFDDAVAAAVERATAGLVAKFDETTESMGERLDVLLKEVEQYKSDTGQAVQTLSTMQQDDAKSVDLKLASVLHGLHAHVDEVKALIPELPAPIELPQQLTLEEVRAMVGPMIAAVGNSAAELTLNIVAEMQRLEDLIPPPAEPVVLGKSLTLEEVRAMLTPMLEAVTTGAVETTKAATEAAETTNALYIEFSERYNKMFDENIEEWYKQKEKLELTIVQLTTTLELVKNNGNAADVVHATAAAELRGSIEQLRKQLEALPALETYIDNFKKTYADDFAGQIELNKGYDERLASFIETDRANTVTFVGIGQALEEIGKQFEEVTGTINKTNDAVTHVEKLVVAHAAAVEEVRKEATATFTALRDDVEQSFSEQNTLNVAAAKSVTALESEVVERFGAVAAKIETSHEVVVGLVDEHAKRVEGLDAAVDVANEAIAAGVSEMQQRHAAVLADVRLATESIPGAVLAQAGLLADAVRPALVEAATQVATETAKTISVAHGESVVAAARQEALADGAALVERVLAMVNTHNDATVTAAKAAGVEAAEASIASTVPGVVEKALKDVPERLAVALLPEVTKTADRVATDAVEAQKLDIVRSAGIAGEAAGKAAAESYVEAAMPTVYERTTDEVCIRVAPGVKVLAEEAAAEILTGWKSETVEAAAGAGATAGTLAGAKAAQEALPEVIRLTGDAVAERLHPVVKETAERVATELNEKVIADVDGKITARTADGLTQVRDELRADLNPVPLVDAAAKQIASTLSAQVESAVAEEFAIIEPRLAVKLSAKIQSEIDRIPVPRDGLPGKDAVAVHGTDGKDARLAAPTPHIKGKTYERDATVTFEGGLWYAYRQTDDVPSVESKDWICIFGTTKQIKAELRPDGRTLDFTLVLSDGTQHTSTVEMPVPIQRGVYKPTIEYAPNDVAIFDGSQWTAKRKGLLGKPGTNIDDWMLSLKRGRDGKDMKEVPAKEWVLRGAFIPGTSYDKGDLVDHAGQRWLANKSTHDMPPQYLMAGNDTWTMLGAA